MIVIELFSGSGILADTFRENGHRAVTSDLYQKADYKIDILEFNPSNLPIVPDVIWCSPPCTTFSVAGRNSNYSNFMPNNVKACLGLAYVYKSLDIIHYYKKLNPSLIWFIENPRGYLRKFPVMENLPRKTVTYCQYGETRMKPTDIWTNAYWWIPKKVCSNKMSCHEAAPRGTQSGTQALKNNYERSILPKELCREIVKVCERELPEEQKALFQKEEK